MVALFHSLLAELEDLLLPRLFPLQAEPALDEIIRHLIELLLLNEPFAAFNLDFPVALFHQIFDHEPLAIDEALRVLGLVKFWLQFQLFNQCLGLGFHYVNT